MTRENLSFWGAFVIFGLLVVGFVLYKRADVAKQDPSLAAGGIYPQKASQENDPSSESIQPDPAKPESAVEGLKEARADLESSDREFEKEYSKISQDISLENLAAIRLDLEGLLADASTLHELTKTAYIACIAASTDGTVFNNCFLPKLYIRSSYSHFGIEEDLRKLPNVSLSTFGSSNLGWSQSVSRRLAKTKTALSSIANDPRLAAKYDVSLDTVRPIFEEAQQLQARALSVGDDGNPVLIWILLVHADLLLDNFSFRTGKYSMAMDSSRPLLE
jgi:hypothetical protein